MFENKMGKMKKMGEMGIPLVGIPTLENVNYV